ncbi:hypothetical protein FNU73_RS26315, partial [Escherichia coli]
ASGGYQIPVLILIFSGESDSRHGFHGVHVPCNPAVCITGYRTSQGCQPHCGQQGDTRTRPQF